MAIGILDGRPLGRRRSNGINGGGCCFWAKDNTVHLRNLEGVWDSNDPTPEGGGIVVAQCGSAGKC
jgi:hypothetical protein